MEADYRLTRPTGASTTKGRKKAEMNLPLLQQHPQIKGNKERLSRATMRRNLDTVAFRCYYTAAPATMSDMSRLFPYQSNHHPTAKRSSGTRPIGDPPTMPPQIKSHHRVSTPHIRFANLPKPNRRTGSIIYFLRAPSKPFHHNNPAHGRISQRRVQERDDESEQFVLEVFENWREGSPDDEPPSWKEINWTTDYHPGVRLQLLVEDGEVSPMTQPETTLLGYPRRAEPSEREVVEEMEFLNLEDLEDELYAFELSSEGCRPKPRREKVKRLFNCTVQ
jgi:hypothetical protein